MVSLFTVLKFIPLMIHQLNRLQWLDLIQKGRNFSVLSAETLLEAFLISIATLKTIILIVHLWLLVFVRFVVKSTQMLKLQACTVRSAMEFLKRKTPKLLHLIPTLRQLNLLFWKNYRMGIKLNILTHLKLLLNINLRAHPCQYELSRMIWKSPLYGMIQLYLLTSKSYLWMMFRLMVIYSSHLHLYHISLLLHNPRFVFHLQDQQYMIKFVPALSSKHQPAK